MDEDRLRKALSQVYSDLTPDEGKWVLCIGSTINKYVCVFVCVFVCAVERNSLGIDRIFVHSRHALYPSLKALYEQQDMEVVS